MPARKIDFNDPGVRREIVSTLIANTPIAYLILDRRFRIHFVNEYCLRMRNVGEREVLGNYCYNIANGGTPCTSCAVRGGIETGERSVITRKDFLPDGSTCYLDDYAIPIRNEDGSFDFILEVMINRTTEMRIREENFNIFLKSIEMLSSMLDKKDAYTSSHSRNVTELSVKLARYLGLEKERISEIRLAALLHDIGKIYISGAIINKPYALTLEEYGQIRKHSSESLHLLDNLGGFDRIKYMIYHHHERWDGTGYPKRLMGESIPLGSRIIALADTYDAMTSNRSYRKAQPHDEAVKEIRRMAGSQFDPRLALAFAEMMERVYGDRESALASDDAGFLDIRQTGLAAERRFLQTNRDTTRHVDKRLIDQLIDDDMYASQIVKFTPAYYTIIAEDGGILHTSNNFLDDLGLTHEQFAALGYKEIIAPVVPGMPVADGRKHDPVDTAVRGEKEKNRYVGIDINGNVKICEVFAVPITLKDSDEQPFPCTMDIFIDRTREMREKRVLEQDLATLLDRLYQLACHVNMDFSPDGEKTPRERADISDYLAMIQNKLSELE